MDNFQLEFARIKSVGNTAQISKELKQKSAEFRLMYDKMCKKIRNDKYLAHAKDRINKARSEKRKLMKDAGELPKVERVIRHVAPPMNIEEVDTSIKRQYADNKKLKVLTESSIKAYGDTIKAVYSKYHDKPMSDDAEILKYLRWEKHNAKKLYKQNEYIILNIKDIAHHYASKISLLYSLFSRFNTKKLKQFREILYPYKTSLDKHYQEHRNDLEIDKDEVDKISFEKADILANLEKIEFPRMKILYLLMFMLPCRRISDYRNTLIAKNEEDIKNEKYNWYYNNKIYINNTKNKQKIVLDIPDEIVSIIDSELIGSEFPSKHLILNATEPYMSKIFSNMMVKIYGSKFTATDIRRIYASYNLKTAGNSGDVKTMLKNQNEMGHNLHQHLQYCIPTNTS